MPHKLTNLVIDRIDLCKRGANADAHIMLFKSADIDKATWTTAYVNSLPDSSFAAIESGGTKDKDGKTTPRSLRHLPYKDAEGNVDKPHLRNALARLSGTKISAALKASAKTKLEAAAKEAGMSHKSIEFGKAMTTNQILAYRAAWDDWYDLKDAFMCSINQIMYDGADAALLAQTVQEFADANAEIGKVLESTVNKSTDFISLDVLFEKLAEAVTKDNCIAEVTALFGKFEAQKGDIMKFDKSKLPAEAQTEIAAIEKSNTDQAAEIVTLKKEVADLKEAVAKATIAPAASAEEIKKSMTPAQLAMYEVLEKSQKETSERVTKSDELAKTERTARRTGEFKKMAETTLKHVPGLSVDEMAKMLLNAEDKMEKTEFDALKKSLEAASAAIAKSMSEIGDAGTNLGNGEVMKEVERKADELRKADPKMTKAQAIAKVFEKEPDLYTKHLQEQAA